jgi:hypothetical protein
MTTDSYWLMLSPHFKIKQLSLDAVANLAITNEIVFVFILNFRGMGTNRAGNSDGSRQILPLGPARQTMFDSSPVGNLGGTVGQAHPHFS